VTRIQDFSTFNAVREAGLAKLLPSRPRVGVGMGTCGSGNGAEGVYHAFAEAIERDGRDVKLASVGCFGFCAQEPLVNVHLPGEPLVILQRVEAGDVLEFYEYEQVRETLHALGCALALEKRLPAPPDADACARPPWSGLFPRTVPTLAPTTGGEGVADPSPLITLLVDALAAVPRPA